MVSISCCLRQLNKFYSSMLNSCFTVMAITPNIRWQRTFQCPFTPYFLNICILVNRISMYIFNGNEFIFILFLTIMTHVLPLMILYVNCYLFSKIFKKHSINIIFIGYNILVFEIIFLIHEPSFCLVWER